MSFPLTATASGAVPGDGALVEPAGWVRIASVSSDPDRARDVRRSGRWLVEALRRAGFPCAEVWETDGLPAVYASWPAADPGAPVLLVHSHHDVHAADPSEWQVTGPFSPLVQDGRLHGRGASDAKGQIMSHVWALRTHGTGLPGDRWHGPDERVEIQALRLGVSVLARFLDELSTGDTALW